MNLMKRTKNLDIKFGREVFLKIYPSREKLCCHLSNIEFKSSDHILLFDPVKSGTEKRPVSFAVPSRFSFKQSQSLQKFIFRNSQFKEFFYN